VKTLTATTLANLPGVNLLPPEIHERQRLRQVQLGLGVAVLAAVGGVVLLYMSGEGSVTTAQAGLATAQAQQVTLNHKISGLQFVSQAQSAVDASEASLTQATSTEIHWSDYLADLATLLPNGVWVSQVSFSESVGPGSLASPADAPALVGAVQISGTATVPGFSNAHNGVAAWLDAAVKEKGFANPWFAQSAESFIGSTKVAAFTSSLTLTSDALTKRCAQPGVC
jgi:Tfp pilus assembly protein PilN